MIAFPPSPIPVIVEGKEAYVLYIETSGMYENDVWTCVHCDGGTVRHYTTNQVIIHKNATFEILKSNQ